MRDKSVREEWGRQKKSIKKMLKDLELNIKKTLKEYKNTGDNKIKIEVMEIFRKIKKDQYFYIKATENIVNYLSERGS